VRLELNPFEHELQLRGAHALRTRFASRPINGAAIHALGSEVKAAFVIPKQFDAIRSPVAEHEQTRSNILTQGVVHQAAKRQSEFPTGDNLKWT
jgi:hypothetical protein